jgi:hypothetical protein
MQWLKSGIGGDPTTRRLSAPLNTLLFISLYFQQLKQNLFNTTKTLFLGSWFCISLQLLLPYLLFRGTSGSVSAL